MDSSHFDHFTMSLGARLSRRRALAAGAAAVAVAGASYAMPALAAQDATPEASPLAGGNGPTFLFVQLADTGTWRPNPDEDGAFLLTLAGTGEQTLYFSDRPDRIVGTVPTQQFLANLGFTPVNPPNAAVVVQTPEGSRDVLVVELYNPVYTQAFGENEGDDLLTYEAKVLNAYQGEGLEEWVPQADDDQLPRAFTQVSLFIDDCADVSACMLWIDDNTIPRYVGEIPGGPYRECYDVSTDTCQLCAPGSFAEYDALCRETYPGECQQGTCFTNVCDYNYYFGFNC